MSQKNASDASAILGKIAGFQGEVILTGPSGENAQGRSGAPLYLGSTVKTLGSSIVVLSFEGLNPVSLGHDETLTITQDLLDRLKEEAESSIGDDVNFEAIAEAVESGESLEELLPATAAGGDGAPTGSGSSGVSGARISLTGDTVTPQSGFETTGPSVSTVKSFIENPEFFNTAPYTSGIPNVAVNEDINVQLDLSSSFFEDDAGQTLSFTVDSLPNGLTFDGETGIISGAATNDAAFTQEGDYVITVTAQDDSGAANDTVETSFVLHVNNVNDLPTVDAPIVLGQINEDGTITIGSDTLLEGASDIDLNDVLSVAEVRLDAGDGSVVDNGDGTFTYTPSENWFGDAAFSYTITDNEGGTVENTGTLIVASVNDAPVLNPDDALSTTPSVSVNTDVLANDADVDGDVLSVIDAIAENGSVTVESDGSITYTPFDGFFGADQISYTVSDGNGGEIEATLPVSVVYNPAVVTIESVPTLATATPTISGSSANIVGSLELELDGQQYEVNVEDDGSWTFDVPSENALADGNYILSVSGVDVLNNSASDTDNFTVDVHVPTVTIDDQDVVPAVPTFSGSVTNADGDISLAVNGVTYSVTPEANGDWAFTLPSSDILADGNYQVVVDVSDAQGNSASAADDVIVDDQLPFIAIDDQNIVTVELPLIPGNSLNIEGDIALTINNETYFVTPEANGDWQLQIPEGNELTDGDYDIVASGQDGQGNEVTAISNITINAVDDIPVISGDTDGSLVEDSAEILVANGDLSAEGGDPGEDQFIATNVAGAYGTFNSDENGIWSYSAVNAQAAIQSLAVGESLVEVFTVLNADGVTSQNITLTINGVNDAPTVDAAISSSTVEDNADYTIDLLAGASDVDSSDTLSVTNFSVLSGDGAGVALSGNTLTVSPSVYQNLAVGGSEVINLSFDIIDGNGGSVNQTVSITVNGLNDLPVVAAIDLGSITEDSDITFSEADLLAGATDADGEALSVANVALASGNGSLTDNGGGSWTFEPDANWNGNVSFSFDVTDGVTQTSNVASLTVTPENDAPVVSAIDLGSIVEDGDITFGEADLLVGASDVDGDALSVENVALASGVGTLTDNGDDTWTFTPDADWNGDVSFSFNVTDGNVSVPNSASLAVTAENDAPAVSVIDLGSIAEDGEINFSEEALLEGASDIDGNDISVTNLTLVSGEGELTESYYGTWTFVPAENWSGDVSFSFDVTDGDTTTSNTASLTVTPENDTPVVSAIDLGSIAEDGEITFNQADLLAGASDVDGDDLSIENVTLAVGSGTLTDNGDDTWTFTPDADWNGDVSFGFDVTDGEVSTLNTASLTVTPENDAPVVSAVDLGSIAEDGELTFSEADLLAGASDVDGDDLSVENVTLAVGSGTLTDNGDDTWTFTPDADWNGDVSFGFDVTDGVASTSNSAALAVTPENDSPVVSAIDLGSIAEDGDITFSEADLLAGASDIDGDDLSVANVTLALGDGTLTDNGDDTWTFTPDVDWNGDVSFAFDVTDGEASTPNTAGLTVTPENDAPVVSAIDLGSIAEDGEFTFSEADLLAGASDVDGDDLSVENVTLAVGSGTLTDNGDDTWTFTPDADWNGDVSVGFDITDGEASAPNTASLAVTPENDAPVVSAIDLGSIAEDGDITFSETDLLAGASDIDGDDLSVANVVLASGSGTLTNNGDDTWTFEPVADWNGDVSFAFDVTDGEVSTPNTASLTVTPENDAPVVSAIDLGSIAEDGEITFSEVDLLADASDVDGDDLGIENVTLAAGSGTLTDNGDDTWTFTPDADWNGDVSFGFDVTDGEASTPNTASLAVTPENDAPVVTAIDLGSIAEDGDITFSEADLLAGASDVEGDDLSVENVTLASGSGTLTDNGDDTWTFTPDADWNGDVSVGFDVTDGVASTPNSAALSVTPENDGPVVTAIDLGGIAEDGEITFSEADLLAGASDVEGDDLSVENVTLAAGSGTFTDNGDNTWTFTPDADWNGDVSFEFDVTDGEASTPNTAALSVTPENDAPVVSAIDLGSIAEDGEITFSEADLLAGASDVEGDDLSVENVALASGSGTFTDNGDDTWTFTPDADWNGDVSFEFDVTDGEISTPNTAALTVTPENDAPVVTAIDLGSIAEDGEITFSEADLLVGASDVESDDLSVENVTLASGSGTFTDNGDDTWTFTPNADWNGDVSFSFDVTDGVASTPNTAALEVTAENDAPVVSAIDLGSIAEDGETTFSEADLLAGASDVEGDDLSVENVSLAAGSGTLTDNGDDTWTFTPDADWNGDVSFSFDVTDGVASTSNTAALEVTAENDAPVVSAIDLGSIAEDGEITFSEADLLAGASDVEGDDLSVENVTLATGSGTLTDNGDDTWTFTPDADWNGDVSFEFDVADGEASTPNTAALRVTPENDAPVVSAIDLGSVAEDGDITFSEADLLAGASDVEGDDLSVENVTLAAGSGTFTDNGDDTWTFTPDADWNGDVSFEFDVTDGVASTPNTAALEVTAENDAPVVSTIDLGSIAEDGEITFSEADLLAGASDVDGDDLGVANLAVTSGDGSLTDNGDDTWTFTPGADWNGDVAFSFDVTDGTVNVPNTADLTVTPVNDEPDLVRVDLGSVVEDNAITIQQSDLLDGITDADGDSLVADELQLTSGDGSLVNNGDGTWTFTPDADWSGSVEFSYFVVDSETSVPNTASLVVTPDNDAPTVTPIDLGRIVEDGDITFSEADLLAGASDIEGDALSVTDLTIASGDGTLTDNRDGTWTFEPDADWNGDVSLSFNVSDGEDATPNTASLAVTAENDAPDVVPVDLGSVIEDGAITFSEADLLVGASDVDGDSLSVSGVALTSGDGTLTNNGDDTWTFTPDADWNGDVSFSFNVGDGVASVANTAALTVTPGNDDPVVSAIDLGSIAEDGDITFSEADLLVGASDIDGDSLGVENVSLTSGDGTVTNNGDGTWTFTPTADWNGDVSFDFDVTDGVASVSNTADLSVTPVNDLPNVVHIDLGSFEEGSDVTIRQSDLTAGITDVDGDFLIADDLRITSGDGSLVNNEDATWTFTPGEDWTGTVEFGYVIVDAETWVWTTASLVITPENDAPTVVAIDLGSIVEDGDITFSEADLLAGASDADGDALSVADVALASGDGTLTDNGDDTWTFTPDADWNGDVSISFNVTDGIANTPNTAAITVTPDNDAPTVVAIDLGSIAEDGETTFSEADLLAGAADVDGDTLSVTDVTLTTGDGTLTDNGDDTWTFTPDADWNGDVSVSFNVTDGEEIVANTASLTVTSDDDTPTISGDDSAELFEDAAPTLTASGDLDASGGDAGEDLFIAETITGTYGDLTINADGEWSYSADNSQADIQDLDGSSESLTDIFTVTNADGVTTHDVTIVIRGNDSEVPDVILEDGDITIETGILEQEFTGDNFEWGGIYDADLASGIDPSQLTLATESDITLTFIYEAAGFANSLGWYQISESGLITNAEVLWENGNDLSFGDSVTLSDVSDGEIGFFLIQDGYGPGEDGDLIDAAMAGDGFLRFEDADGNQASSSDDGVVLVYYSAGDEANPAGTRTELNTTVHAVRENLNSDGLAHSDAGLNEGDTSDLVIGFEDRIDGDGNPEPADWDLRDMVFSVQISSVTQNLATIAPDLDIIDDGTVLQAANVRIVLGRETDDLVLNDAAELVANSYGIASSYDANTRTLSLSGDATIEQYEEVLATVQLASTEALGTEPRQVEFTVTDSDGLTSSAAVVNLNSDPGYDYSQADFHAGDGDANVLSGLVGDDVIFGGQGDDDMSGGAGSDTFVWASGDEAGSALDTISDFTNGLGGDVLHVADLLQGESADASVLENYLSFSSDGTDTTISVDVDGDGVGTDMSIVLEGIDLTTLGGDQAILQSLLDNGNIITD